MRENEIDRDAARVIAEYERRQHDRGLDLYYARIQKALHEADEIRHKRQAALLRQVGRPGDMNVLDVGCGRGEDLAYLARHGWNGKKLVGVEIFSDSVIAARSRIPEASIIESNAARLPFPDGHFDAVMQTTVLSSVTSATVRGAIVSEMFRVVRPGGLVLSWDLKSAGANPNLIGIDRREIGRLFSAHGPYPEIETATVSLAFASRLSPRIVAALRRIPLTHVHLVAWQIRVG
jgi:ubiquinone/menaquinone biosynthesis C-methylase UbiE